MGPLRIYLARCVAFCVVLCASSAAMAQSWDPFPTLNGSQRAGIIKRYDSSRYDDLRRCLRRFDSRVGADYYAALVDVTDEAGSRSKEKSDGSQYAGALAQEWASDPAFDLEDHVLIVIGVQNQSLGIDVGSKWEKVGFTGETVTDTIAASEYGRMMGRRNYGEAICSLATAIDFRLASLRQTMERRIEEVGATFPEVEAELEELTARVDKTFKTDRSYAAGLREKLETATAALASAKKNLKDDPAASVGKVDEARDAMSTAEEGLERYIEEIEILTKIEAEIDELESLIAARDDADWEGPTQAATMLGTCREQVAEIRDTLEGDPAEVRICIAKVRGELAAADVRHDYVAGTIPTIYTLFLILALIVALIIVFLRRRRTLRIVDPDLAEWGRRLDRARDELGVMVDRYPDYFALGDVAWEGESATLDAKTADAVNRAFFLLDQGGVVLKKAREKRAKGHPLSIFGPTAAATMLRETETLLPAGMRVESSPIEVPTTQSYGGTSAQLLGDLHDAVGEAEKLLAESANVLERLAEASAAGDQAEREAVEAVAERQALSLSADHLRAPLDEARGAWKQAKAFTKRDPLRSDREDVLDQARQGMVKIRDRAVGGNEAVALVRGELSTRLNAIRHGITRLKSEGFGLSESNFDAAAELDALTNDAKRVVERIGQGDERRAIPLVDELEERSTELARRVEITGEARELVPTMASKIDDLREAVRGDILKLRIGIGKMPDGSIPKAELDELMAFQTTLGRVSGELTRLNKSHGAQDYLAATAHVHRLMALMERGVSLVNALAAKTGVGLQSTPAEISWPAAWSESASASWESGEFGGSRPGKSLF